MANKGKRQRVAKALGLRSLSESEYAELDIEKALAERRADLRVQKVRRDQPVL